MSSRQFVSRVVMMATMLLLMAPSSLAWTPAVSSITRSTLHQRRFASFVQKSSPVILFAEDKKADDESDDQRTTFDQAGASLIEEEDKKRMDQMGDSDQNDAYQTDSIEKMRAAIRDRTAGLGIEKSKVTADYIAEQQKKAMSAGPPGVAAQENPDAFGGLDLSQISRQKDERAMDSQWNEDMPSMFYDPEEEMTEEEMKEVDPVMLQNPVEQGWSELSNAKWPDMLSALREVGLMLVIIALSGVLIIGWDKVLRNIYTSFGFIPTKEELMNYATKFDGLDLPSGWTDNMNDADVQKFQDTVNSATSSAGIDIPDF